MKKLIKSFSKIYKIAVVGATNKTYKHGYKIYRKLKDFRFLGLFLDSPELIEVSKSKDIKAIYNRCVLVDL